jgi:hypothetical protein
LAAQLDFEIKVLIDCCNQATLLQRSNYVDKGEAFDNADITGFLTQSER